MKYRSRLRRLEQLLPKSYTVITPDLDEIDDTPYTVAEWRADWIEYHNGHAEYTVSPGPGYAAWNITEPQ